MVMMKVLEGKKDHFIASKEIREDLSMSPSDILIVKNPINQRCIANQVEFIDDIEKDVIKINKISLESIGLDSDFDVEVYPFNEDLTSIEKVKFGVENFKKSENDPLTIVKENEDIFIDFIKNKIFTKSSKFHWEKKGLLISIKNTCPGMNISDVGKFKESFQFTYEWGGSELKSFDGVLLLDMSGSMEIKDLNMEDVGWVVERMSRNLDGKYCQKFLNSLKGNKKVRRSHGAVLCALVYLVQKIGRGIGDRISMIPFSDESSVIEFDGKDYFSSSVGNTSYGAERIVEEIFNTKRSYTNLSDSFKKAIDVMKNFDRNKMKMIVVLTDGKPNPKIIDCKENLLNMIKKRLAPRKDIVVNAIGLGNEVDHKLLDKISVMTGGEYTHVNSLEGLTQAYTRYATSISVKGSTF